MSGWIHEFVNYIHNHPEMGELFAFVVAFLESLPIIGTIIPGSITMTAVGTMVGAGLIPGYLTLFLASLGAFIGDTIGFATGRILKDRIRYIWPFTRWPKMLSVSETFFNKHGGKSILIGRFVGAARSAVPLIAGVFRLSWWRFIIAGIPSAILWAVVYSIPGIILGAFATDIPPERLSEYIGIGVGIIFVLWVIFWLIQRFFASIVAFFSRQINRLWQWLTEHRSTHWLITYLTNQQDPQNHHQLTRLVLMLLCCACFIILLVSVLVKGPIYHVNQPMFHFAQSFRAYHIDPFFLSLSLLAKPPILFAAGILIAIGLGFFKQWRAAVHLTGLMIGTFFVVWLIKTVHYNPRPDGFMIVSNSSSFPSGHTAVATSLFTFLAILSADTISKQWRWIVHLVATLFILLIAASRLYLGAHWFLDVSGSIFLGLTLALLTSINYHRFPTHRSRLAINKYAWFSLSLGIIAVCWAGYAAAFYKKLAYATTPFVDNITITKTQWLNDPLEFTPEFRKTRFGSPAEPLNVQWVGSLTNIEQSLIKHHWKLIRRDNYIKDTINRLASHKPEYHLSFLKLLYHNEKPALILYKPIKGQKWVYLLHLWNSHIKVGQHQLWIGMLNKLIPPHEIITFNHRTLMSFKINDVQNALLSGKKDWQIETYTAPDTKLSDAPPWYHWNSNILLLSR